MKLIKITPLENYHLLLEYDDGIKWEVEIVLPWPAFQIISNPTVFKTVSIGDDGDAIVWNKDIEVDALAQYMKITGKQLFTH